MSKPATSKTSAKSARKSRSSPSRVKAMSNAGLSLSDAFGIAPATVAPGAVRLGSEMIQRGKTRLTMYLDTAVVEYFRSRSGGRGYQTLINEALKQAIERENLEDALRRVIREETRPYKASKG